jgi:archaellum component FlaC
MDKSKNELLKELRLSHLAQEELRSVAERQKEELESLQEFASIEREALFDEKAKLTTTTQNVEKELGNVREQVDSLELQVKMLESALESAAMDRAKIEAAARETALERDAAREQLAATQAIERYETNDLENVKGNIVRDIGLSITRSHGIEGRDRSTITIATKEMCIMDM